MGTPQVSAKSLNRIASLPGGFLLKDAHHLHFTTAWLQTRGVDHKIWQILWDPQKKNGWMVPYVIIASWEIVILFPWRSLRPCFISIWANWRLMINWSVVLLYRWTPLDHNIPQHHGTTRHYTTSAAWFAASTATGRRQGNWEQAGEGVDPQKGI